MSQDLRTWDARTRLWGYEVGVEAETRVTDGQALERRLSLKLRDGGVDRLIVVVADTRHNRTVLRALASELNGLLPIQGRAAVEALHSDADPGGNLLILV
jgi:hypothetical protein